MKLHHLRKLQQRREFVQGRFLVGIDPAKHRHQAQILTPGRLPQGSSFSFDASFDGFHHRLWKHLAARLPEPLSNLARHELNEHLIFAVEVSGNLWPTLAGYLQGQHARLVVVSPLATCHGRPSKSGDFSRSQGRLSHCRSGPARHVPLPRRLPPRGAGHAPPLHHLRLNSTSCVRTCSAAGLVSVRRSMDPNGPLFPEFAKALKLNTLTARHLLGRYLTPDALQADFLSLELDHEAELLRLVSHQQHGRETLLKLQALARPSVGLHLRPAQPIAERGTMDAHLVLIEAVEREADRVSKELVELARQTPYHTPLVSLKGVSDLLAALFIAELREPSRLPPPKQIERLAGYNLYVCESGTYKGRRRISHLGDAPERSFGELRSVALPEGERDVEVRARGAREVPAPAPGRPPEPAEEPRRCPCAAAGPRRGPPA